MFTLGALVAALLLVDGTQWRHCLHLHIGLSFVFRAWYINHQSGTFFTFYLMRRGPHHVDQHGGLVGSLRVAMQGCNQLQVARAPANAAQKSKSDDCRPARTRMMLCGFPCAGKKRSDLVFLSL